MRRVVPVLSLLCAGTLLALDSNRTLTQYVHRIWTLQQGLPAGTIYDMWQTHDGFLWLATQAGLVRFDGVSFTPAEKIFPGLPENLWMRAGFEDPSGALWVGTNENGIWRIKGNEIKNYGPKEGMPSDLALCLIPGTDAGKNGDLWACTSNGLVHLKDGRIQVEHLPSRAGGADLVRAACLTPEGALWVGGDGPALFERRTLRGGQAGGFESHPLHSIPPDAGVRAIACSHGTMWVGTTAGLVEMNGDMQRLYTEKDGLVDDAILSLKESADGSLWIGTRSGFSRLRNGEFESFRPQDGLSQSSVFSLYEDREGSLWAGTKHGLNQFVDGRAIPFTVNEGLPSNNTGPVLEDRNGESWVGMLDAGLARFDGRRFYPIRARQGLASDTVLALAEDADGSLWVGTDRGLNRLREGRVEALFTRGSGLPSDEIRCLYRDPMGRLWVGTAAGLAVLNNGAFSIPEGSPRDPIVAMAGDREGRPMFSTEHGVFRLKDTGFEEIAPNGAPLRNVDAIYRDPEGLVWLGTNGNGLRLLDESSGQMKTSLLLMRDGLFDSEIYGIAADDLDHLWLACSKGIFSVSRSELRRFAAGEIKKVNSTQYSPTDALRVIECKPGVQPGVWKTQDGRVWFSTIRGLIVLNPSRVIRNVPPPPVVIEDPIVNGESQPAGAIGNLAPGQKNIEFNYTGLSFVGPARLTFRYMLEGYDPNWIDAGVRREAYYTNLPPRRYRFRVTACNGDGLCNEAGSVVEFTLAPQLYQRAWFWPALVVLAALLAWAVYEIRIRRLRAGIGQRYDLILAERSRIARELHDTLIQGFSGITMELQALVGKLRPSDERRKLEEIIGDAANCLRETRRSVAGLRNAPEAASGLAGALAQAARQITETKDVRLKLKLDQAPRDLPPEFEYNLLRIACEAISNAVKHSAARTIEVTLETLGDGLRLSIADDGIGFDYRDHGYGRPGHYGIIGMKERAAQIGADIEFGSAPGRGATVRVLAPVGRPAPPLAATVK
ncbi:MAG TPA: two-component regulator propeller domain-containing protein [Bryobacteraceae bacterium]